MRSDELELADVGTANGNGFKIAFSGVSIVNTALYTLGLDVGVYKVFNGLVKVFVGEGINNDLFTDGADYEIINDAMSFRNEGDRVAWYEAQTGLPAKAGTGITEASFFTGSDRVILGPGPRTLHQANEHVTEEKLNKVAEIYLNLIKKECL